MYQDPCSIYLPRLSLQTLVILHSKTPSCCKYLMWTASYGSLVKAPKNGCRLPHSRWGCTWTSGRHTLQVCKPSQQSVCIWLDGQQRCKGNLAAPPHPVSPIWLTLMELADVFYLSSNTLVHWCSRWISLRAHPSCPCAGRPARMATLFLKTVIMPQWSRCRVPCANCRGCTQTRLRRLDNT